MTPVPVPYMAGAVERYIEQGASPGPFLTALFSNDLKGAFRKADDANVAAMADWVRFMVGEMPADSHGSPEAVRRWVRRHAVLECAA